MKRLAMLAIAVLMTGFGPAAALADADTGPDVDYECEQMCDRVDSCSTACVPAGCMNWCKTHSGVETCGGADCDAFATCVCAYVNTEPSNGDEGGCGVTGNATGVLLPLAMLCIGLVALGLSVRRER